MNKAGNKSNKIIDFNLSFIFFCKVTWNGIFYDHA